MIFAKMHNIQDNLLKFYAPFGHPFKLAITRFGEKYNKLPKLSTKKLSAKSK